MTTETAAPRFRRGSDGKTHPRKLTATDHERAEIERLRGLVADYEQRVLDLLDRDTKRTAAVLAFLSKTETSKAPSVVVAARRELADAADTWK